MRHCLASGSVRAVECILSSSEVNKTHTYIHIESVLKINVLAL